MLAVAGAALIAVCATHCVATATDASPLSFTGNNSNNNGGIISFPLLSHHHVVDRRHRELRATTGQETDNGSSLDRIPNLRPNHRNLATNQNPQQQLGALYQGYGTHYIDIWVGHPAQRQTAVVDTGSSVTAFPCSECTNCGHHTDLPFQERASESFRMTDCPMSKDKGGCTFGKCNDDGICIIEHNFGSSDPTSTDASSWTAYEAQDVAYAGGPHDRAIDGASPQMAPDIDAVNPVHAPEFSFALTFGCQTSVSGYFEKQLASGVMGLDRRAQSFWGQMRAAQTIHRAQFSLCFVKQPIASMSGSTAGAVTLGGVDKRLHKTPMVFAKSVGDGSTASFKVQMRKMYLREGNDQSVMFDAKAKYHLLDAGEDLLNGDELFNFDSGTTDTYFIHSFSDEFRKLWKELTGMEYSNDPIAVNNDADLLKFPTVVLQMISHNGGIGDEVKTGDPREVPGLAGNVDMSLPNDVLLAIPPKHYMQRNAKDKTYTPRIYLDRDNALGNVLGANVMMGHDILFDMEEARIGFSESECDYARVVAESSSSSAQPSNGSVGIGVSAAGEEDDSSIICDTMRCRGLFGITLAVFFVGFFLFARRYISKKDDVIGSSSRGVGSVSEYEMKSSRNLHSSGNSYSDDGTYPSSSGYSDDHNHLPPGERGGYQDNTPPPPSYSDHRLERSGGSRNLDRNSGSSHRRDRSGSRESDPGSKRSGERRSSRDRGERRSSISSRDSGDGNTRSTQSIVTHRSQGSGGSGGSGGSRETRQSSRSHRSSRTHETHRSNRSSGSRESNRSKESNRSESSRERRGSGSREGQRSSSRRGEYGDNRRSSRRIHDDYDGDIPMPPSIS